MPLRLPTRHTAASTAAQRSTGAGRRWKRERWFFGGADLHEGVHDLGVVKVLGNIAEVAFPSLEYHQLLRVLRGVLKEDPARK